MIFIGDLVLFTKITRNSCLMSNKKITFSNQLENLHQSSIFLVLHHLPVFHHLPRNLSNFIWDSSKGDTFVSHHNGKVGIEVRNFFDCYESMETAVAASTVSQEMLTKYHEAVEVATKALLSDISICS